MVYERVSKPFSGNSFIHKKASSSTTPAIPAPDKSPPGSPQEQEMPSYTPLPANWATNNNLMRSLSEKPVVQRQEQADEEMEPIQAKLTIGQVGDKYEQEADQTAQRVVNQINAPAPVSSTQALQREEMPEEKEIQMKPASSMLQREEMPEEKEVQMKPMVQRQSDGGTREAQPELETSIQQAKGSGQPLTDSIKEPMEKAFGADFSSVNIHTDAKSDQLNQSIQAKAFTTGQDIFFRQGAYDPGSRGGQELIAHELTHVVQQSGAERITNNTVQRDIHIQCARGVPKLQIIKDLMRDAAFGDNTERRSAGPYVSATLRPRITPVTITNKGNDLEGRFYEADQNAANAAANANTIVLLLTGSAGSAEAQGTEMAKEYTNAGVAVLSVNYRGFGKSHTTGSAAGVGGEPSEAGVYSDAEAMFNHILNNGAGLPKAYPSNGIIIHGFSLGGPIAAHVAKYAKKASLPIKMLVLDRAMPSIYKASKDSLKGENVVAGVRHLGAALSKAFLGKMSIDDKVAKLGKNLPILFATAGDQMRKGDLAALKNARKRHQNVTHVDDQTLGHMDSQDMVQKIILELQANGHI